MTDRNANRPGYKKTPVGWIPVEWECCSLGSISQFHSGGTPSMEKHEYWGGDIPWFSAKDLKTLRLESSIDRVTEVGLQNGTRTIPPNTILVLVRGMMLNRMFPVGITTMRSCFNQDLKAICVGNGQEPLYIAYLLISHEPRFLCQVDRSSHGTGKLATALLETAPIPLPPLPEQRKIAAILSTWDTAIDQTRALLAAALRRKQALMQQLLTGKKRLPGFAVPWKKIAISCLLEEVERPVVWDDNATYSLLSVRRASGGAFLREELKGTEILTKNMYLAKAGDFLISKMQVLHGAMALVPDELDSKHISGSYIALRPRTDAPIHPVFFSMLTNTPEFYHLTYLSSYGVHIEKMTFNLEWFLQSTIRIPDNVKEQRAIAAVFTTADEEIKALAVDRDVFLNGAGFRDIVDALTAIENPPDGYYLLVGSNGARDAGGLVRSDVFHAEVIAGWMYTNYALSINGARVINGYCHLLSPLLGICGAEAAASGWFSGLRRFSMSKYVKEAGGGRAPVVRYVSTPLLSRIKQTDFLAFRSIVPEIASETPSDTIYDRELTRTEEAIQSWEAIQALSNACITGDVPADLNRFRGRLQRAAELWSSLQEAGLSQEAEANLERIEAMREGITLFEKLAELA